MPSDPHFEVSVNTAANLLRTRLWGDIDGPCMHACVDEIERLLPSLGTNFKSFTDLSGLRSMDTACIPDTERMMDLCRKRGVSLVVRVIPDRSKDIGFSILSLFHYSHKVHIVTCPTLAEGERALA
jgi:ABC-type transporter Mla MlaB component